MTVPLWLVAALLICAIGTPVIVFLFMLRLAALEGRLGALEEHNGEPPSRIDLSKDIGKVAERVRGLEIAVDTLRRVGETTNQYLHTVIEQGLRK